jgi:Flp pilus assembly protein TadG
MLATRGRRPGPPRRPGRGNVGNRGDKGALTLTYVIIVPVFLVAVMVIVQTSLWYLARQAALAAARQGADAARAQNAQLSAGPRAALAFARTSASGYLLTPAAVSTGSSPATVEITVTGQAPSLVPGINIKIRQVARAPVEQFTTP